MICFDFLFLSNWCLSRWVGVYLAVTLPQGRVMLWEKGEHRCVKGVFSAPKPPDQGEQKQPPMSKTPVIIVPVMNMPFPMRP